MSISKAKLITTAEGGLYGFSFALYIACARLLYPHLRDRDRRRKNLFTLVYMSLIMALSLYCLVADAREMSAPYVAHAGIGGLGYAHGIFDLSPISTAEQVAYILLEVMFGGIQLWRLRIVWSASRYSLLILIFPLLCFFVFIGIMTASTVIIAESKSTPHLSRWLFYGQFIPGLSFSATVTIPIIIRIFMFHRRHTKMMGRNADTTLYTSVIAMFIESFALETVWTIFLVFLIAFKSTTFITIREFLSVSLPHIQLLAFLLVIYRVSTGRAWKEDTAEQLTTLEWDCNRSQITESGTGTSITMIQDHYIV